MKRRAVIAGVTWAIAGCFFTALVLWPSPVAEVLFVVLGISAVGAVVGGMAVATYDYIRGAE